jgi:hypothetical protein
MFGVYLGMGFAFGGDELITAMYVDGSDAEISAGTGMLIGLGVSFTPLRASGHALGLEIDQNVKLTDISASTADISLTRFPLVAALQYSYEISPAWHFVVAPGLVYEYGISLTGSGDAEGLDEEFDSALGWMVEGGVAYRERSFVVDATLRFTKLTYHHPEEDADVDASSGGLMLGAHYIF